MALLSPLNDAQIQALRLAATPLIIPGRIGHIATDTAKRVLDESVAHWLKSTSIKAIEQWTEHFAPHAVGGVVPADIIDHALSAEPWAGDVGSARQRRYQWRTRGMITTGYNGIALPEAVALWVWRTLAGTGITKIPAGAAEGWPVWYQATPGIVPTKIYLRGVDLGMPMHGILWTNWSGAQALPGWQPLGTHGAARWATTPMDLVDWWPGSLPIDETAETLLPLVVSLAEGNRKGTSGGDSNESA